MALRTSPAMVMSILGRNYDTETKPDLTNFILTANDVVNNIIPLANKKSRIRAVGGLPSTTLLQIETWLAAHFYCHSDPLYNSRSTEGASGSFQVGTPGAGFASTQYGRTAMDLDISGVLKNINMQQFASGFHMGNHGHPEENPECGTAV